MIDEFTNVMIVGISLTIFGVAVIYFGMKLNKKSFR